MLRLLPTVNKVLGGFRKQCIRVISTEVTEDIQNNRRPERGLNKVTLIGRVGRQPEIRGSEARPCLIFPLATNKSFTKANGEFMTKVDWHRVCIFRPGLVNGIGAKVGQGDKVYVDGSISYTKFDGEGDDREITVTSIIADEVMILSKRRNVTQQDNDSDGD